MPVVALASCAIGATPGCALVYCPIYQRFSFLLRRLSLPLILLLQFRNSTYLGCCLAADAVAAAFAIFKQIPCKHQDST
jgi:hypothetical protein